MVQFELSENVKKQLLEIVDDPATPKNDLGLLENVDDFDIREAVESHPNYKKAV